MFKYTLYLKDSTPEAYSEYLYRLLNSLKETILFTRVPLGISVYVTEEGSILMQELITHGAIKVNTLSEHMSCSVFDVLPATATLFVAGDVNLMYELRRRYPSRNVVLLDKRLAKDYTLNNEGLRSIAYLVHSFNRLELIPKT